MIALTFICPNCLCDSDDAFCIECGRQLRAADLTTTTAAADAPREGMSAAAVRSEH